MKLRTQPRASRSRRTAAPLQGDHLPEIFELETNQGYRWAVLPAGELKSPGLHDAAVFFGLTAPAAASVIIKPAVTSSLYRLETKTGSFVLRAESGRDTAAAEAQCRLAANLKFDGFIRPLQGIAGRYVLDTGSRLWSAYRYEPGQIFEGGTTELGKAAEAAAALLEELAQIPVPENLPAVKYSTLKNTGLTDFVRRDEINDPRYAELLRPRSRQWLRSHTRWIGQVEAEIRKIQPAKDICVTHNDLNHANVILNTAGKVVLLDMEDIAAGNPLLALCHCVFKLVRHSIYSHRSTPDQGRRWLNDFLAQHSEFAGRAFTPAVFFQYSAYRIFSDLEMLLVRARDPQAVRMPADFEKKIQNLAELALLTGTKITKD